MGIPFCHHILAFYYSKTGNGTHKIVASSSYYYTFLHSSAAEKIGTQINSASILQNNWEESALHFYTELDG
jgi:hypothetical protein